MKDPKKIISLALAVFVAFSSMNVTAFASNSDETEIVETTESQDEDIIAGEDTSKDDAPEEKVEESANPDEVNPDEEESGEIELAEENKQADLPEAETDKASDFTMSDDVLTAYTGAGGDIVIPDDVYEISENVFKDNTTITGVTIPVGTKIIGDRAFSGCSSLTKVTFNETSNFSVGDNAFSGCSIIEVNFADGLEKVPDYVLDNAGFGTDAVVNIPESVKAIGIFAFNNEGAKSVSSIQFQGNSQLTSIGKMAFSGCVSMSSFAMPQTVTAIGSGAFSDCTALTAIDIPDAITSINQNTFENCTGLTAITLSSNLTTIGTRAFYNTGLTSITIPSKVNDIEKQAFAKSPIASVELQSKSITTCKDDIFQGCAIASVTFPEGITTIPALFDEAGFVADSVVTIPASAEKISKNAFINATGLSEVVFEGEKLKEIGESAFEGCTNLATISLPNSITTLGSSCFASCEKLTSVVIPANANTLGNNIYQDCTGLTSVTFKAGTKKVAAGMFRSCTSLADVTLPETITLIDNNAFNGCRSLAAILLPDSTTKLGNNVFYCCSALETITVPANVTSIGENAFYKCVKLSKVNLGNKITTIGNNAFSTCYAITEFTMPNSVTSIGRSVFDDCKNMEKVSMSEGITSLPSRTFADCAALKYIYLGSKISKVSDDIFEGISSTKSIRIYAPENSTTYKTIDKSDFGNNLQERVTAIKYNLNGGSAVGTYPISYASRDSYITIQNPERDFYKFQSWYLDAKFANPIGTDIGGTSYKIRTSDLPKNTTLYAKWDGPYYVVKFNAGTYGTVETAAQSREVKQNETYGVLPTVTLTDSSKVFLGWYTSDGEEITATTKVTAEAKRQTLYAKYRSKVGVVVAPSFTIVGETPVLVEGSTATANVGDKLQLFTPTMGAIITYSCTAFSGNYGEMISLDAAGTYVVTATAEVDGVQSTSTTVTITVAEEKGDLKGENAADYAIYSANTVDCAGKLWVVYNDQLYTATREYKETYTGSAVKLNNYRVYFDKQKLAEGKDFSVSYKNNTKAVAFDATNNRGASIAPTITYIGKGSISGNLVRTFTIENKNVNATKLTTSNTVVTLSDTEYTYDGTKREPSVVVTDKKSGTVIPATEYTVSYSNNKNAGSKAAATVLFNGNNYYGTITKNFKIKQHKITDAPITIEQAASVTYTKGTYNVLSAVKYNATVLEEKTDYTVTKPTIKLKDGVITGSYKITGKGNYSGTRTETFTVNQANLSSVTVGISEPIYTGKKGVYKPAAYRVTLDGIVLKENSDYKVTYKTNDGAEVDKNTIYPVGTTFKMVIEAKSGYLTGSKTISYTVKENYVFSDTTVSLSVNDVVWADRANICNPKYTIENVATGKKLSAGRDFSKTITYKYVNETIVKQKSGKKTFNLVKAANDTVDVKKDIIPAGTEIKMIVTGTGNYNGTTVEKTFRYIYDMRKVSIKVNDQAYTGNAVRPGKADITVKYGKVDLANTDYEVVGYCKNTASGTATLTIKGNGAYCGTKDAKFKIKKTAF